MEEEEVKEDGMEEEVRDDIEKVEVKEDEMEEEENDVTEEYQVGEEDAMVGGIVAYTG